MSATNNVILVGRVTKAPTIQKTSNGTEFCNFTLAVNRMGDGADFIFCTAWKGTAKFMEYVTPKDMVSVQGELQTYTKDNVTATSVRVTSLVKVSYGESSEKNESGTSESNGKNTYAKTPQKNTNIKQELNDENSDLQF